MSKTRLARNVGSMSIAVFISRILGLIRDIVMTNFFGTTNVADAFQVAFQIPNLLRKLFGEGALSAAFVPIYNDIGIRKGKKYQISFALQVLTLLSLILMALCLLGILLSPLIVRIFAPGFDPETRLLTIKLTRILFPYLFLIGISSTLISILNSHDRFFIPGLSSAFLNIGMIGVLGLLLLLNPQSSLEEKIIFWSLGVLLGGILQTVINFPSLARLGYHIKFSLSIRGEAIKAVWQRFVPGVFGIAIRQVNLIVDLILASLLATGSIAALNYGNRLMQLPLGILGVSAGVAVLPHFSRLFSEQKWMELKENLRFSLLNISFVMLPITVLLGVLGKDMIRIIFFRGAFDLVSLNMTYKALLFYSCGLLFYSWNRILIPLFYANKDTRTPVFISAFIVVLNIVLNIILMQFLAHAGLALATSISAFVHYFILRKFLKKKVTELILPFITWDILKILFVSIVLMVILIFLENYITVSGLLYTILKTGSLSILGIIFYLFLSFLVNVEPAVLIVRKLWQKRK